MKGEFKFMGKLIFYVLHRFLFANREFFMPEGVNYFVVLLVFDNDNLV